MVSFPYYSHTTPMFESLKIWEARMGNLPFSGVPSLGVPENTLEILFIQVALKESSLLGEGIPLVPLLCQKNPGK